MKKHHHLDLYCLQPAQVALSNTSLEANGENLFGKKYFDEWFASEHKDGSGANKTKEIEIYQILRKLSTFKVGYTFLHSALYIYTVLHFALSNTNLLNPREIFIIHK